MNQAEVVEAVEPVVVTSKSKIATYMQALYEEAQHRVWAVETVPSAVSQGG